MRSLQARILMMHTGRPELQGQGLTHQEVRCSESDKVLTLFVYLDGVGYYDEFTGYSATECQFLRASLG